MNVPTRMQPPSAPVFSERDLRDPALLGWALLVQTQGGDAPPSEVYDHHAWLLARVPAWNDRGLMSSDPAKHHSKVKQTPAPEVAK